MVAFLPPLTTRLALRLPRPSRRPSRRSSPYLRPFAASSVPHPSPPSAKPAASAAVFHLTPTAPQVLLIRRRNAPNAGLWSLPGGRPHPSEQLLSTALRELHEETALSSSNLTTILHTPACITSAPGYTISVFAAVVSSPPPTLIPSDDALTARFFPIHQIPPQSVQNLNVVVTAALAAVQSA